MIAALIISNQLAIIARGEALTQWMSTWR
jgi:hypothetical protein